MWMWDDVRWCKSQIDCLCLGVFACVLFSMFNTNEDCAKHETLRMRFLVGDSEDWWPSTIDFTRLTLRLVREYDNKYIMFIYIYRSDRRPREHVPSCQDEGEVDKTDQGASLEIVGLAISMSETSYRGVLWYILPETVKHSETLNLFLLTKMNTLKTY